MLQYCKMILEIMTIDTSLFRKELKKAYKMIKPDEVNDLNHWVMTKYPHLVDGGRYLYLKA